MRVLVAGGRGYIGAVLVPMPMASAHQVALEHTFVRLEQINQLKSAGRLDDMLRRTGLTAAG